MFGDYKETGLCGLVFLLKNSGGLDNMTTERDFKGVWIPREIWLNDDLCWSAKLLLVEIDSLAKNGECFASNEYLGKFLKLSKKRVSELITELNRKGLVTVELIYKEGTKQIEKRVIRPMPKNQHTPTENPADPLPKNRQTPLPKNRVDINTYNINTINNTNNKRSKDPASAEIEREFEQLWQLYPRKIGRKKAFDSYKKARKTKKIPFETVLNGLYRYIKYLESQATEEQYIMHASTWFNQEKWLDDYITTGINRKPKNAMEYMRNKYGNGESQGEPYRNGEIIDHYSTALPDPF